MISQDIFSSIFIIPVVNALVVLYRAFLALSLPGSFGLAIVALTAGVRLAMHPLFVKQMDTQKKMSDLKPHLDRIGKKHKEDPRKLQAEQMRIYKEAGLNPASGCLLIIVQMPIFIGLYNALSKLLTHGSGQDVVDGINNVLYMPWMRISAIDPFFLGFNLALSPQQAGVWYYYLVPVITAALQYFQTVFTMRMNPISKPVVEDEKSGKKGKKEEKKDNGMGDFQQIMNTQMKYIFPIMIGWFAFTLPVGMSLYWNIFSIFSIVQYRKMAAQTAPTA